MPQDNPPPSANPRDVWRRIAAWWDARIGEGNDFQERLIMPVTDRLLNLRAGEMVLDACCGNGNYSRRMARASASVVAFDGAEGFIERAKHRTSAADGSIEYRVIDATDESQLAALGEARFDAAVCSMAMMDLPTIAPLLHAIRRSLKPAGRFVFSVSHPCFNSNNIRLTAELIEENGRPRQVFGVQMSEYIDETASLSVGILNQPEPHPFFHRPIEKLLSECFAAGFVVDGFEEPAFPMDAGGKNAFSWAKRPKLPPAMVVRLRPQNAR